MESTHPDTIARIRLTNEVHALIDRCNAEIVSGFRWRLMPTGYVIAQRNKMYVYLHRLIAGAGPADEVDHINRDPLDNRMVNLRIATKSQNAGNRSPDRRRLGTTSRHKGVSWAKSKQRWVAYIHTGGKTRYLGTFTNEDDAARAYNTAALAYWGEFARPNDVA